MSRIALERTDVIVGVDTHKDEHVAVAIDGLGGRLDQYYLPVTNSGYAQLLAWSKTFGRVHAFGVEGTGSYGMGLTRFLRRHAETVIEVSRPPRAGHRRLAGKSDPIDAEHAARQVLAGQATATPKVSNGAVEAIRLTRIARNTAVKAHTQAIVTLKATLVTASDELRAKLEPLSDYKLMTACVGLDSDGDPTDPDVAMRHVLCSLARRWLQLHEEIKTHTERLKELTTATAPRLLDAFGIGPDIAGELLVAAGHNTGRIRSEAAFAKLCGVCPIPAGSGKTGGRYRLNRGGNRQANAALYRAVIVRMRWHAPTIAYVQRRTTEGLSKKEIIRCLKRYVAREAYSLLPPPRDNNESLSRA
jgi:transposase|tara:strand:- start:223 stop:1302 length:1080 start_codon:yes stop_codon:yes gene_type:complete